MVEADDLARRVSLYAAPDVITVDEFGLVWREVETTEEGFILDRDLPENSSVLIALPLQRTVAWTLTPHSHIHDYSKVEITECTVCGWRTGL